MIMGNEDIEAMADIFQEYGISAPVEIIEKVASDFIDHLDAMRDMEMTPFANNGGESDFQKVLRLERELSQVKTEFARISKENQVYHDSVMQRRNASEVWIEDNTVKYSLGTQLTTKEVAAYANPAKRITPPTTPG